MRHYVVPPVLMVFGILVIVWISMRWDLGLVGTIFVGMPIGLVVSLLSDWLRKED
jgi:hypothetical protein